MAIAVSIKRFLQKMGVTYREHPHYRCHCFFEISKEYGISPQQIAVAEMFQGKNGKFMVVHSLNTQADATCLSHLLGEEVQLISTPTPNLFPDSEPGSIPPLPEPYGISGVVDLRLFSESRVYFCAGSHNMLISVSGNDFAFLLSSASRGVISRTLQQVNTSTVNSIIPDDIHLKLLYSYNIPELPLIARCILQSVAKNSIQINELASLVKTDPALTARVCANGDNVETVLEGWGANRAAANLFGLTLEQSFCVQQQGFLGAHVFWKRAYLSAALTDMLGQRMTLPNLGLATLGAIMHDIGILLVGHWFPPELKMMSRLLETQPGLCLSTIEQRVMGLGQAQQFIGLGHAKLGAWLAMQWQLPEAIVASTAFHHIRGYNGEHKDYVSLMQLVDQLLTANGKGIDDITNAALYFGALAGVTPESIQTVLQDRCLMKSSIALEAVA